MNSILLKRSFRSAVCNKRIILIFIFCLLTLFVVMTKPEARFDLINPIAHHQGTKQSAGNATETTRFHKMPRVFCWIMTSPNSVTKAKAVRDTWVKRCDGYIFISSVNNTALPAVAAGVAEGRGHLWGKTQFGFRYAYEHGNQSYDWFLKADDDTYVVVENLRYFLSNYSSSEAWYFGHQFKPYLKEGYNSGGAGYVLSKEALKRFIQRGLNKHICRDDDGGEEDVEMALCLEKVGVTASDTRDAFGRGRFFPFAPETHVRPMRLKPEEYVREFLRYPEGDYADCCSDMAISFHHVDTSTMHVLEYLLYHLRPISKGHINKWDD